MNEVVPITASIHILVLLFTTVFISCVCIYGKKTIKLDVFCKRFGFTILFFWFIYNIYYFVPTNFSWSVSLPLHLCDLVGLIAAISLIFNNDTSRSILYFSGIALTTQAFITPTGDQSPSHLRFWLFWGLHVLILSAALFDLIVKEFRPRFKDYMSNMYFGLIYITAMMVVNFITGWNYGYVGNSKPGVTTVVDFLGEWPLRVAYIIIIAAITQFLLLVPFLITNKNK